MEALIQSTLLVALGEIGDKTQLLTVILIACYRRPIPILLGITAATLLNHAAAAYVGIALGTFISPEFFGFIVGTSFIALGVWVLKPDSLDDACPVQKANIFLTTLVTFFFAEMGDKTQVLTIALGAHYLSFIPVVLGTTSGMLLANIPAIIFGRVLLEKLPLRYIRYGAALIFFGFGLYIMLSPTLANLMTN